MNDKQFMSEKRRRLKKIYPFATVNQCSKNFSFRIHGVGHGTTSQEILLKKTGENVGIKKLKTMSPPYTPYIYVIY